MAETDSVEKMREPMLKRTIKFLGALLLAVLAMAVVFLVGMRKKSPPVLNAVRQVNRSVFNPRQMESAGTPGAYASIVRHIGRTSGSSYETPVGVAAIDGGFVIALPYGAHSDWLKNVLAAGSATIVTEGETFDVDQPEVVPIAQSGVQFPADDDRAHRFFGVDQCLKLRIAEPD